MTTSEQMRRLAELERAAEVRRIDDMLAADVDTMHPYLEEMAASLGVTVDVVVEDARAAARRIAEVGEAAYELEVAAECGCSLEELRSGAYLARINAEWAEWQEQDRARRAEVIYWRGGIPPIPYRNGQPITDGSVGSW